ncbi:MULTISPECIES: TerD family protein [Bacillus]|uniref:TerD family protein n=1 Tax=Bacillus TaxID=1386 RepID=UPI000B42ECFA|nr:MULTISPECIES: TerD family protein [Bacillus]MBH0346641.1 stress protein [Bacillus thuringiensis]MDA1908895.1 TerD family protein [Bacillus cereus]MDA2168940.1 TerD family protein [Bacillus cereus]MDQ7235052.1 TerD family protein [Bacillus pacificus]MDQ7242085.1 TerD family protein [Bacillus pacificus]
MPIILEKGQKIDLTKGQPKVAKLQVGLGWDPIGQSGGFLSSLFGSKPNVDCDASVVMLEGDRFVNKNDLVYFGNKLSTCGSIIHSGDNLTGEGEGDDETIFVELHKVPSRINRLVFVVNIYDCVNRRQDFGMIRNAYIRIQNQQTGEELARYNLSDNYAGKTTLIAGEMYRHGSEWKFSAVGEGTQDKNLSEIVSRYQ